MLGRNDPCWCGSGKKWKKCHFPALNPAQSDKQNFETLFQEYRKKWRITLKNEEQIVGIRRAGHLAASILDATCAKAKAGVSTLELNDFAHQLHMDAGAIPAPLHYGSPPFPKSICTSLNEVICHGIPNSTPLVDGDILNIDVTVNPQIPHKKNKNTIPLGPGMTFTIEPMINAGARDAVIDPNDHWTARTVDLRPSAQWEHTVLITEEGYEILTPWERK